MQKTSSFSVDYPYVANVTILLFCGYVLIWYLQIGYRFPFLGKIRFEFIYAAILTVIALFTSGFAGLKSPLLKYLILFFLCFLIAIPFSCDIDTSWIVFVNRVVKFSFMALFIVIFVKSPGNLKYFIAAFMLACLKMGQEGFIGNITDNLIWQNQGIMRLHGSTPIYEHPNSFSGMALGTLPFIYYLMPISPRWLKAILAIQLAFAVNIILFSGSRTGYIAFLCFVFFVFLKSESKKKFLLYFTVIVIIAFPLIPIDYTQRFHTVFTGHDREGHSIELRREIIRDAWRIFLDHPLGVGISAFPAVREATFGRTQDTHNLYLEVATNLGVQGFVIFMLLIAKMLKQLNSLIKSESEQIYALESALSEDNKISILTHLRDLKLMQAVSLAVIMFIIIRLALGLFGMDLYEIYWWFSLGLTISLYNMNNVAKERTRFLINN